MTRFLCWLLGHDYREFTMKTDEGKPCKVICCRRCDEPDEDELS